MKYRFEWDPRKARQNLRKHRVDFPAAAAVLRDPLAKSVLDDEHSQDEERWASIGRSSGGELLVVIHTFQQSHPEQALIRIISARRATRQERLEYEEGL